MLRSLVPRASRLRTPANRRGLALISVLWVLTLLSLIAASFMRSTRTETNLAYNFSEQARAEAMADAGVHQAIFAILQDTGTTPVNAGARTFFELMPGFESAVTSRGDVPEAPAEPAAIEYLPFDGIPLQWRFGGGRVIISLQDETAKIDLNHADPQLLRSLFMVVGVGQDEATALADAVVDFRDPDDATQLNGAEDDDYSAAGLVWDAKDAPFVAIDELQQVLGMTPELYRTVFPALTVHAGRPQITEVNAPLLVRAAIRGLTDPDGAAAMLAEADMPGNGASPGMQLQEEALARAQRAAAGRTNTVGIRSEAVTESGARFVREAVVRLISDGSTPFRIEDWRQGRSRVPAANSLSASH
ncbi:MAG TPA: hypothetical protein VLS27_16540 [Gammaproteobacteria bacterium]|nr:hypothetical protein [Gammaproteobacteria bacterium]